MDSITPYIQSTSPITITATASDGISGVRDVALWYRYSSDNSTWGSWTFYGLDSASPWSWSFNFPNGEGYYGFYSIANDTAGNQEAAPPVNDTWCHYRTTPAETSSNITLYAGWNLISLDRYNSTNGYLLASEFAAAAGSHLVSIVNWNPSSGSYGGYNITYMSSTGKDDFPMYIGVGYWVYMDNSTPAGGVVATIWGQDKNAYGQATFSLTSGRWNLVGWFNTTTVTTDEYCNIVNDGYDNGARGFITRWNVGNQDYDDAYVDIAGVPPSSYNFNMVAKEGYWTFINTVNSVTY